MKNIWVRTVIAVFTAELIPIILLVVLIALMSTGNTAVDAELAPKLGVWVGPIGGAIATFCMAWWAMRSLQSNHLKHGAIVGGLVACLDWSILFIGNEPFQPLFAFSGVGRVVAGICAGLVASRSNR